MENIPKISINEVFSYIYNNKLPFKLFNKINDIIKTHITSDDLIEFMQKQKIPPIRNLKSKKLIVDESKRSCKRFTFGKDIVKYFIPDIEKYLKKLLIRPHNIHEISDLKIDETHGDILYYDNCGFFKKHRDQVPKKSSHENTDYIYTWKMYTLIISLDTTQKTNNGNTIVWTIDNNFNSKKYNYAKYKLHIGKYNSIPHSYKLDKSDMLLFPSEVIHEASALLEGEMTLKLKLDVWIKTSNCISFPYKFNFIECKCCLCKPKLTYRKKIILRVLQKLDIYLKFDILEYLDIFKPVNRCLYKYFNIRRPFYNNYFCSCVNCVEYDINQDEEEKYDLQQQDYDDDDNYDMCNGYEYDDRFY